MSYVSLGQTTLMVSGAATCLSQAQHDEALKTCRYQTIKGLGALPSGDPCELAKLPICAPLAPMTFVSTAPVATTSSRIPPPPVAIATLSPSTVAAFKPSSTTSPSAISKLVQALKPVMPPPSYVAVPQLMPSPVPAKKMSVAMMGLIAAVAVGGGYLVYRKMKKPAPAKMAANRRRRQRRNSGTEPPPKFKVGDTVKDTEVSRMGIVVHVAGYDDLLHGYRYKVQESDGTRLYWNEPKMRLIRRNRP